VPIIVQLLTQFGILEPIEGVAELGIFSFAVYAAVNSTLTIIFIGPYREHFVGVVSSCARSLLKLFKLDRFMSTENRGRSNSSSVTHVSVF
jgi:hypothetical protein